METPRKLKMQIRLKTLDKPKIERDPYNKYNSTEQWIRITSGCSNNCPFCYEPTEIKQYPIPKIIRNYVKIMDMNILERSDLLDLFEKFRNIRVNNKVVYYELICGIDFRKMNFDLALLLKSSRFKRIRLAWDFTLKDQYRIKDCIKYLLKAGFKSDSLMVFMVCNWKISYLDNLQKLDLCKIWRVQVADCYYDNQLSPNIIPSYWTGEEIKTFRKKTRKHNQLVRFGIDPNIK